MSGILLNFVEKSETMTVLTAADYADTGQWRLIVKIHPSGMSAHLENTIHGDVEPQELFSTSWDNDPDNLLRNIENAVYDHPRVLDDFSARIIIFDRKTLFMPTALLEDTDSAESAFYTALYQADEADVMYDTDKDITAAFHLAPGLKGFINRTFPGARVGCNLMQAVARQRHSGEGHRLFISVRDGEADYVLLNGEALVSASTNSWAAGSDIAYHAFNLFNVYGVNPKEAEVELEGIPVPADAAEAFTVFSNIRVTDNKPE